jgi:hypothetical protein
MRNISTFPSEEDSIAIQGPSSGLAFDGETFRQIGYQVMDEVASYLSGIRERPVWQAMPDNIQVEAQTDLELISSGPLSIERFRYAPPELRNEPLLLDRLNKALAHEMQQRGRAFLTSTCLQVKEALRACIVDYMTTEADIQTIVDETIHVGKHVVSRYS